MERHARVWKRILAFVFDILLAVMLFEGLLLFALAEVPHVQTTATEASLFQEQASPFSPLARAGVYYWFAFLIMYHIFCEYIIGQTAGMMLMRIRAQRTKVSRKIAGTEAMGFWQTVARNLFLFPPFMLLWLIEPLYYVFQGERLLEYWTKTETVE